MDKRIFIVVDGNDLCEYNNSVWSTRENAEKEVERLIKKSEVDNITGSNYYVVDMLLNYSYSK